MKETGDVSKTQTYGFTKKAKCGICTKDLSNYSYQAQNGHLKDCVRKRDEDKKQMRLF